MNWNNPPRARAGYIRELTLEAKRVKKKKKIMEDERRCDLHRRKSDIERERKCHFFFPRLSVLLFMRVGREGTEKFVVSIVWKCVRRTRDKIQNRSSLNRVHYYAIPVAWMASLLRGEVSEG